MTVVYGVSLSPFVRKLHVVLREKGIPFESVPTPPGDWSPAFRKMSPLGRIPVLETQGITLCDSSVACAYLDRKHPTPSLYPADPEDWARALWLERLADSKLAEAASEPFRQRVLLPMFLERPGDEDAVLEAVGEELPPLYSYFEEQLGDREWLVGDRLTIADISVGSVLGQMRYGGVTVPARIHPRLADLVERVWARESFRTARELDEQRIAAA